MLMLFGCRLLKEWGGEEGKRLAQPIQKLFAVSFFVLRVLWMPYTWIAINRRYPSDTAKLGKVFWSFYTGIVALQLYWALLIVRKHLLPAAVKP